VFVAGVIDPQLGRSQRFDAEHGLQVAGAGEIDGQERTAIVYAKTAVGAEVKKTEIILADRLDHVVGQAVSESVILEPVLLAMQTACKKQGNEQQEQDRCFGHIQS